MKALISFLQLKLHRWFPERLSGMARLLWKYRDTEAVLEALVPGRPLWIGDSRIHQFENEIKAMGHACLAVSGSKIEDWNRKALEYAKILRPSCIIEDLGGNNFLSGQTLDDVCDRKRELLRTLRDFKVFTIEVTPVGTAIEEAIPGVQEKIRSFNEWQRAGIKESSYVCVNDSLAPQGFLNPEDDCGDHVHFSAHAWQTIKYRVQMKIKEWQK